MRVLAFHPRSQATIFPLELCATCPSPFLLRLPSFDSDVLCRWPDSCVLPSLCCSHPSGQAVVTLHPHASSQCVPTAYHLSVIPELPTLPHRRTSAPSNSCCWCEGHPPPLTPPGRHSHSRRSTQRKFGSGAVVTAFAFEMFASLALAALALLVFAFRGVRHFFTSLSPFPDGTPWSGGCAFSGFDIVPPPKRFKQRRGRESTICFLFSSRGSFPIWGGICSVLVFATKASFALQVQKFISSVLTSGRRKSSGTRWHGSTLTPSFIELTGLTSTHFVRTIDARGTLARVFLKSRFK